MNLLESVQALFKKEGVKLEVSEAKLAEAILEDGTQIYSKAEEWAEGVDIFILNEEQEEIPLPMGEYKLEDGTVIMVEEAGVVASIGAVAEEEEVEASEESSELTKEDVLKAIEVGVGMLRNEFAEQFKSLDDKNLELSKEIKEKEAEVEKIKAEFEHEGLPRGEVKKEEKQAVDLSKLGNKERFQAIQDKLK